ncbi:hypothetical protein NQ318_016898 [Aromia moschata]|uniref:Reverse transcriptase domain-containing protein n=1 Tax=Aromia moschata TaxID=1265417 RepID=A0AAV8XS99_9CUCU|nr:hypothetical protein NQ318_016898 [Aromia moschata]
MTLRANGLVRMKQIGLPDVQSATKAVFYHFVKVAYVLYNGEYFQQHEGTAMGNSLSPFIANLFMSKFETEVKYKFEYFPRVWFRYVDDIFARNVTNSRQLDAFESLEIIKCNNSMNKDNGPIPTSPLFALINKDSCGSVNRGNKFGINSATAEVPEAFRRGARPRGAGDGFEPPVKLQCTAQQHGAHPNEGLTKFSVEIVQQLEFTTSAASSQPQQISTNVTVKTHANASVKSDVSSPKSNPSTPASGMHQKSNIGLDVGTLVECVKQEPDNDFADLDQCAAALEKDAAANGGAGFGGFSDLIGDDTNDEIISSAAFKDLISDISNYPDYPELMKDFDFEDKPEPNAGLKMEDIKELPQNVDNTKSTHSPLLQNQNYSPPVFDGQGIAKGRMSAYSNMDFAKTELSPAAQTLKQMAEQHQHKNQMNLSFNPGNRAPSSRSPSKGDYGSPNSTPNFHKGSPGFPQDMIKQEMIFQGNEYDMKRKGAGMYKQQYSPYSSPSASSHGSPGYLPRAGAGPNSSAGPFGGGTPPRPPSGPGGNGSGASVQINQAQQLNISQQSHGHAIQYNPDGKYASFRCKSLEHVH